MNCQATRAKLSDRGVRRIEFVDPSGKSADARPKGALSPDASGVGEGASSPGLSVQEAERRYYARKAAQLVLAGKCGEARKLVLEAGNLEAAAQVAEICR